MPTTPRQDLQSKKILLVDDSRATRQVVTKMLAPYHCEVVQAVNGHEGLAQAQKFHPDLIILDITMPVMDGRETLVQLKNDSFTQEIPVIILTAQSQKEDIKFFKNLGASACITKTDNPKRLIDTVLSILRAEALSC